MTGFLLVSTEAKGGTPQCLCSVVASYQLLVGAFLQAFSALAGGAQFVGGRSEGKLYAMKSAGSVVHNLYYLHSFD